jgi:predicted small secreted protein
MSFSNQYHYDYYNSSNDQFNGWYLLIGIVCLIGAIVVCSQEVTRINNAFTKDEAFEVAKDVISSDPDYDGSQIVLQRHNKENYLYSTFHTIRLDIRVGRQPYIAECFSGLAPIICDVYPTGVYSQSNNDGNNQDRIRDNK